MTQKKTRRFSLDFKLSVLSDYYASGSSKNSICRKYDIDRGSLYYWLKTYSLDEVLKTLPEETKTLILSRVEAPVPVVDKEEALEARIVELEEALAYANLRSHALNTMIDIAEENEGIQIRKKPGTKQ